jgi:tRNA(Ile)-lysidine synthase TilS/MesJ
MITIGIVGSRRRAEPADFTLLTEAFFRIYQPGDRIVSGGCAKGADAFAEELAKSCGISITIHYPRKADLDAELAKKNPRAAITKINYERNQRIADEADILIALTALDRKGGTEDTIKRFLRRPGTTGSLILA